MNGEPLSEFFDRLVAKGRAPIGDLDPQEVVSWGVPVRGREAVLDEHTELLDAQRIVAHLSADASQWLDSLLVKSVTGSTNTDLMQSGCDSLDGQVILAETQLLGRGRRGRRWASPFARNIAVSMGVALRRSGAELGCVSLIIGLAVLKALESLGVSDLALKWPNDILYQGRKLCGVLIEMDHSRRIPQAVIGVGINHGGAPILRGQIDQHVSDLMETKPPPLRNETAAVVISHVCGYAMRFNRHGFAPFQHEWDTHHFYRGQEVRVTGSGKEFVGLVLPVSDRGELRLRTEQGEKRLSGGEVSMRPVAALPLASRKA